MTNWKTYRLDDVVEKLIDYRGKTPKKTSSGVPLITAKIIKRGTILTPQEFISEEDYDEWMTRGFPEINDVVLTTEAPLGEVALIKDKNIALAQRVIVLRGKENILDSVYQKYYLQAPIGQNILKQRATGTTVTGIKQSELRKIPVSFPPFPEQKAIASILSSLDDKIELNNQINKNLEALAQTIFKQWFIDFEFLNKNGDPYKSSGGKMVVSELEEIPEGWSVGCLKEIALNFRKSFKPDGSTTLNYFGLEHIPRKSLSILNWGDSSEVNSQKSCFDKGDILFGKLRPYFHKVILSPVKGICSTDILVVRSKKKEYQMFVLMHLFGDKCIQYANSHSSGTRMPRVNWNSLSDFKIALPNGSIINRFQEITEPLIEKIFENINENRKLSDLRNTILPKLMSGALELTDFNFLNYG